MNFDDMRPYNDSEVAQVLGSLIKDLEFLSVILRLKFRWLPKPLAKLLGVILGPMLKHRFRNFQNVHDIQLSVDKYLTRSLLDTSSEVVVHLTERQLPQVPALFMCNHRDIAMDPAISSSKLFSMGLTTPRIAIGDNLLTKPFAASLMRLNKSFIVKRDVEGLREKLIEFKKLSAYIRHSILRDNQPIWIAQREGRAKDGLDKTDPALVKMLMLSKGKEQSFSEAVSELNIVPLCISYEWDPCDRAKAIELAAIENTGEYQKAEHEDISTIGSGISGWKGRIDFSVGTSLEGRYSKIEDMVVEIDRQIVSMYRLQPSNLAAFLMINSEEKLPDHDCEQDDIENARSELLARSQGLSSLEKEFLLSAYANPVLSKIALQKASDTAE